ncbi:MAG TPA: sugar kinase [Pseudonocardiaceae bacterium]|nr:sugar kinase [Pseudonocardiaceae bacterium]
MVRPVVVVGDVVVDVLVRPVAQPLPGTDTAARVRTEGGGGAANTAAWLARLGVPVTLVARIGDDAAGREQDEALRRLGVRCALAVDPAAPTGTVVVLVGPDGERTMLTDRGANLRLAPADLPELPAGGHLHLSGYPLLHDGSRPAALAALRAARRAGLTVSVDPASTAPLAAAGPAEFIAWTRGADLLLPNLPEARLLSGREDPAQAARALAADYGAVAITLGPDGALWARGGELVRVSSRPVEIVDSTGAGDAFCAGLLAAWLDGAGGRRALRPGIELACRVLARLGARPV